MQQFELFDNLESSEKEKSPKADSQFAGQILKFKRSVLFVIYSLILLIIGFVFGVEHNKNDPRPIARENFKSSQTKLAFNNGENKNALPPRSATKAINTKPDTVKYIIQVGSYKNIDNANLVSQTLKKQGFSAYLVSSQPYVKVCVGPYNSRIDAEGVLKTLRKKFPYSFIK